MSQLHNPAVQYRPEVDGLRAIAVLPVILFHAGVSVFSGGFVGVDIFFVISGYLITSIILAEMLGQRFSLVTFYERRARRILPPLFVMLLACLPLAWLWLDPLDFKSFAKSLVAVPLFSSNILFWRESGYFDADAELKPLLHTWTLAVEEQYYVLIPLFLMLAWKLGRRAMLGMLALVAVASLVVAEQGARGGSTATFYLLHARAWELLVGSFIAFYFSWKPRNAQASGAAHELGGLAGLGLIAYAIFGFDHSTPFPGLHALVPTLGAALIIVFAGPRTWVGRLLSVRPMVAIGLISYSAYLWHQPLFAFARHHSLVKPELSLMLALAAVSLVLAWASWRYVERVFRQKQAVTRPQVFRFGALASVLFIAFGMAGYASNGFANRFNVDPRILEAFQDPTVRAECDKNYDGHGWGIDFCYFGAPLQNNSADVAVFGDSHSEAMLPAFDEVGKRLKLSVVHLGIGGCPPLLGVDVVAGNYDPGVCETLARRQYDYVKTHAVKKVVLVSRWTLYTDGDYGGKMSEYFLVSKTSQARTREASRQVFQEALATTIDAYRKLGVQVDIVAQVPQQMTNPRNLYYRLAHETEESQNEKLQAIQALSVPYEQHEQLQRFTRQVFEQDRAEGKIRLLTLDNRFCSAQRCLIGDQQSWYKDFNHLNGRGVELVAGDVSELLAN